MTVKTFAFLLTGLIMMACQRKTEQIGPIPNYDSLRIALEKMHDEDQEIRRILVDSIGFDSPEAGYYIKRMQQVDARNQDNIKVILQRYGWIPKSKIGVKASEAFFYIVQHSDVELMEKYFPEFKRLAGIGEADPVHAAMMEDRLLMWKGHKQLYGTQAGDFRPDKKMAIWPIEDPEHVNERRRKIGFTKTVEEYAKDIEATYDPNEQVPVTDQ
ncbi:MAG TPA: DUF6624 domain-containing protein [Chryseosolibacter sp.]|nr:DUF6624 domain-containing protein [Chryseosolibacter sp.]